MRGSTVLHYIQNIISWNYLRYCITRIFYYAKYFYDVHEAYTYRKCEQFRRIGVPSQILEMAISHGGSNYECAIKSHFCSFSTIVPLPCVSGHACNIFVTPLSGPPTICPFATVKSARLLNVSFL